MTALTAERYLAGGFTRRGACPALSAPMKTGDGLLVRLNPLTGGLSPVALIGLCAAASDYGNGIIEVTARGSIQIRGLSIASAAGFAEEVDRIGIPIHTGVPVQTGVLAGIAPGEIVDPTPLVKALRSSIASAGLEKLLGPKVSVVIDGGGKGALDEVAADVRLTAKGNTDAPKWIIAIAGDAATAKTVAIANDDGAACHETLALLSRIASMGREARARDLNIAQLPHAFENQKAARPVFAASLIGTTPLRNGHVALGVALPFGQATSGLLQEFARNALTLGIEEIRPAPGRTLVAVCRNTAEAQTLRASAQALGFIISADDSRQGISACPGAPSCASGRVRAREMASKVAQEWGNLLDGSVHLHISGCAKGCAHPASADLVLVGSEIGTGLIVDGTARDEPLASRENDDERGLANVANLISAERKSGETTAQAIRRIGHQALAGAFRQGRT